MCGPMLTALNVHDGWKADIPERSAPNAICLVHFSRGISKKATLHCFGLQLTPPAAVPLLHAARPCHHLFHAPRPHRPKVVCADQAIDDHAEVGHTCTVHAVGVSCSAANECEQKGIAVQVCTYRPGQPMDLRLVQFDCLGEAQRIVRVRNCGRTRKEAGFFEGGHPDACYPLGRRHRLAMADAVMPATPFPPPARIASQDLLNLQTPLEVERTPAIHRSGICTSAPCHKQSQH